MNSLIEQETIVNFSRTESGASIWTSDGVIMARLDKLCLKSDNYNVLREERTKSGELVGKEFYCKDKSLIKFAPGKKNLTDAQREKLRERMRRIKNKPENIQ